MSAFIFACDADRKKRVLFCQRARLLKACRRSVVLSARFELNVVLVFGMNTLRRVSVQHSRVTKRFFFFFFFCQHAHLRPAPTGSGTKHFPFVWDHFCSSIPGIGSCACQLSVQRARDVADTHSVSTSVGYCSDFFEISSSI